MDMNDIIFSGLLLNSFPFLIHAGKAAVGREDIFFCSQIEWWKKLILVIGKCNKICNQLLRTPRIDAEHRTCIMNPKKDIPAFSVGKSADRIKQRLWQIRFCFFIFKLIVLTMPYEKQKLLWQ